MTNFKIKGQINIYPSVSSIPDEVITLDNFTPLPLLLQRMKIIHWIVKKLSNLSIRHPDVTWIEFHSY